MSITEPDLQTRAPGAVIRTADQTQVTALSRRAGMLREEVHSLHQDVGETHRETLDLDLRARIDAHGRRAPRALLESMSIEKGFAWTSLAKMMRVSIPAIRKWRNGESISGENRRRLSILAAFIEMLEENFGIADPASWMEMPLIEGVPITAVEVYSSGHYKQLLEFAGGHRDAEQVLDEVAPQWRDQYPPSEFEVFTHPDGAPAFTRKGM